MGVRNIFDGLYVDQLFQKNERGETLFYPFGMMGRGYLLPAEREERVRQSMRWLMLVSLVVGISFGLLAVRFIENSGTAQPVGWVIAGSAFLLLIAIIVFFQSRLARGLEPAIGPRPAAGEWLRLGRKARRPWTYWVSVMGGVLTLLLAVASIALGFEDGDIWSIVGGAFLMLAGAFLTWDGAMGLIEKARE